ncbi:hypothetical protein WB44_07200 [Synechococcus sp. WH 8020]|uniref:hypothetical protein n=1 Tax=Synechococcus sp. (strain WH8020) TaxID=32052 RepID=UPI0006526F6A|nr:hypothetical protein [Synechococcus sp. WH 8020]AKN60920.1 hypothetical protein WB44_07200 [Synechococcus sp. WH 8020]
MKILTNKMDWKSRKGKAIILLLSLGVILPIVGKVVNRASSGKPKIYSSLEKAEAACTWWRQTGDVHESISWENARHALGLFEGQGSCDYVNPSLTRRYPMNGKELVLSRVCVNDKANNTIVGRRNDAMETGKWVKWKNEGVYEVVTAFRY